MSTPSTSGLSRYGRGSLEYVSLITVPSVPDSAEKLTRIGSPSTTVGPEPSIKTSTVASETSSGLWYASCGAAPGSPVTTTSADASDLDVQPLLTASPTTTHSTVASRPRLTSTPSAGRPARRHCGRGPCTARCAAPGR